jgi:hypothetical protein
VDRNTCHDILSWQYLGAPKHTIHCHDAGVDSKPPPLGARKVENGRL